MSRKYLLLTVVDMISSHHEVVSLAMKIAGNETARKMAEHRQAVMENYLAEFMAEWEGKQ